jgi:hypothetical protein
MMVTLLIASGCASTVNIKVEQQFPTVLSEPRDIRATVVFDQDFRNYSAAPNENTVIDIGSAQVNLLGNAFRGLFRQVEVVSSRDEVGADTELVIIPSVREVQISVPSESYLNVYEVWIKYNLDIRTADAVPIGNWFLPAYGKTPDSMLTSRTEAIEEATIIALRDAGAKLLLDFFRIPAIHGWMQEQQDHP